MTTTDGRNGGQDGYFDRLHEETCANAMQLNCRNANAAMKYPRERRTAANFFSGFAIR